MTKKRKTCPRLRSGIGTLFVLLTIFGFLAILLLKTSFTISQVLNSDAPKNLPRSKETPKLPEKDLDRINILLLGIRGMDDPGEGKLLSDAIVIVSVKKSSGKVALISIPRDLYVEIWDLWQKAKINAAYSHNGLDCAKKTVSLATGLHIDYAASANFKAFKEAVDALGGITVYLEKPFEESFQWTDEGWEESKYWFKKKVEESESGASASAEKEKWVFSVPAGENVFDGKTALYYVRSRFSTSDFDRMRRQQKVLMAVKKKVLSLGVLTNPVKVYNLLDIAGENIRTDMNLADIKGLISLSSKLDINNIKELVFDTTPQGLLYDTFINNEYVLLPVNDDFGKIQEACREIFRK